MISAHISVLNLVVLTFNFGTFGEIQKSKMATIWQLWRNYRVIWRHRFSLRTWKETSWTSPEDKRKPSLARVKLSENITRICWKKKKQQQEIAFFRTFLSEIKFLQQILVMNTNCQSRTARLSPFFFFFFFFFWGGGGGGGEQKAKDQLEVLESQQQHKKIDW